MTGIIDGVIRSTHEVTIEGIPAEPAGKGLFEKTTPYLLKEKEKAAKERDLEVWRQAYNAAIACDSDSPVSWKTCADMALADYRAKREEMGR